MLSLITIVNGRVKSKCPCVWQYAAIHWNGMLLCDPMHEGQVNVCILFMAFKTDLWPWSSAFSRKQAKLDCGQINMTAVHAESYAVQL